MEVDGIGTAHARYFSLSHLPSAGYEPKEPQVIALIGQANEAIINSSWQHSLSFAAVFLLLGGQLEDHSKAAG